MDRGGEERLALVESSLGLDVRELGKVLIEGSQISEALLFVCVNSLRLVSLMFLNNIQLRVAASNIHCFNNKSILYLPCVLKCFTGFFSFPKQ